MADETYGELVPIAPPAAEAAWARPLTLLRQAKYLGSHPTISGQHDNLIVAFYDGGIGVGKKRGAENVRLPWHSISALESLDQEGVRSRVTLTRLVLFGGIGLLAKKSQSVGYLSITDRDGVWLFEIPQISAVELRGGLANLAARFVPKAPPAPAPAPEVGPGGTDVRSRLRTLEELRTEGLVSEDEYQARRRAILDAI